MTALGTIRRSTEKGVAALSNRRNRETVLRQLRDLAKSAPYDASTHTRIGDLFADAGSATEAVAAYRSALALEPASPAIRLRLGNALHHAGDVDEALDIKRDTAKRFPNLADVHYNLGISLRRIGDAGGALDAYWRTVRLNPLHTRAWNNLAILYTEFLELRQAHACLDRVLQLEPGAAHARFNRSLAHLLEGNLADGWNDYEWRHGGPRTRQVFDEPLWDGSPQPHATLRVCREQGLGDEILFSTCLPDAIPRVGRTLVECDPRLVPLHRRSFPDTQIVSAADSVGADLHVWMGSLPGLFRRSWSDFPRPPVRLHADPERVERWKRRLSRLPQRYHVGISWQGGLDEVVRRRKSARLDFWSPLFETPSVNVVSLQYDATSADYAFAESRLGEPLHRFDDLDVRNDLDELAALMKALDAVVTVSNASAHLAAALGCPTFVLLPWCSEWRWFLDRATSPWYSAARLVRQTAPGDWTPALERAAELLRHHLSNMTNPATGSGP